MDRTAVMASAESADLDEDDEDAILAAIQIDDFQANVQHSLEQEDQE